MAPSRLAAQDGYDDPFEKFIGRGRIDDQSYTPRRKNGPSTTATGALNDEGADDGRDSLDELEGRRPVKRKSFGNYYGADDSQVPDALGVGNEKEQETDKGKAISGTAGAAEVDGKSEKSPRPENRRTKSGKSGKSGNSASLEPSRSYGDGHGFHVFAGDGEHPEDKDEESGSGQEAEEKQWEVQWDGEGEVLNPRNLGRGRKWIIVLLVSAGSTCV